MPLTEQQKQYQKEYKQKNKEKLRLQKKIYNEKYREKNKEKLREYKKIYDEKNKEKKSEYMKDYNKSETAKIQYWKRMGVKCDDFNALHQKYINTHNCERCGCEITLGSGIKGKKHLDHDHMTGEFRNIVCGTCNIIVIKMEDKAARLCKIKVSPEVKKQIEAIAKNDLRQR